MSTNLWKTEGDALRKQEQIYHEILHILHETRDSLTFVSLYEHLLGKGIIEDVRGDRKLVVSVMRQLEREGNGVVSLVCPIKKNKEQ